MTDGLWLEVREGLQQINRALERYLKHAMPLPERALWISVRQALLIVLGAIETRYQLPRTVPPKRHR